MLHSNMFVGIASSKEAKLSVPFLSYTGAFSSPLSRAYCTCNSKAFGCQKDFLKQKGINPIVSPHRAVSAFRLLRVDQGGAFVDLLDGNGRSNPHKEINYIERTLGFPVPHLDEREMRLATEIVCGAVRWRQYLDYLIHSLCKDKKLFRGMEPLLLQILRVGFYEILMLDTPPYAIVSENVSFAKVALRPSAGNFVNGMLRTLIRLKETSSLPLPQRDGNDRSNARALSVIHSHPLWMVRRWTELFGEEETVRLMKWNNSVPGFCLRINSTNGFTIDKLARELDYLNVSYEFSPYTNNFVRVKSGMQRVIQSRLITGGLCSVQDESAGMVVYIVDPHPGETIIDCCAAPGGKAIFMASCLRGRGMISAIDINEGRLRILKDAAKLHNVEDIVTAICADVRNFAHRHVKADKVLLDAPCSGLGVLAKRPDLRWNRRSEDLAQLKVLQDELLDAASMMVKSGGVLVYSTCSIDPSENEERVHAFLRRHMDYSIDPVSKYVRSDFVMPGGFFFSNPVKHSIDGSFAARLLRS